MLRDVTVLFVEADPSTSSAAQSSSSLLPAPQQAVKNSTNDALLDDSVVGKMRAQTSAFSRERGGPSAPAGRRQCPRGAVSAASFITVHKQQQQQQQAGVSAEGRISVMRAGESAQLWRTGDRRLVASALAGNERWRFSCPALFIEGSGIAGISSLTKAARATDNKSLSAAGKSGDAASAVPPRPSVGKALSPRGRAVAEASQGADTPRPHGVWIAAVDRATFGSGAPAGVDSGPVNTGGSALVVLDPTLAGLPRQQGLEAGTRFLPSSVVRLLAFSLSSIIVVLDDGSIFETDPRLRRLQRLSRGGDQLIECDNASASWRHVWCELYRTVSKKVVVIQALQRDDMGAADVPELQVLALTVESTSSTLRLADIEQISVPYCGGNSSARGRRRALSCSFDPVDSQFAVLWDDGAFDVWAHTFDTLEGPTSHASEASLLLSRRGLTGLVSVENGFLSFVGANTIATVMSTVSRQRRTSRNSHPPLYETDIQLWDTSYGTLRARRVIASSTVQMHSDGITDIVGTDCVDPLLAGVLVDVAVANLRSGLSTSLVEANMAIAFERAVILVSIVGAPVSLANVLSTPLASSATGDVTDDNATTVSITLDLDKYLRKAFDSEIARGADKTVAKTQASLAPEAAVAAAARDLSKRIARSNAEEADAILKLSSRQETPSTTDFWKVFFAFAKKRLIEEAHARRVQRGNVDGAVSGNDSIPLLAAHEEDEWDLHDEDHSAGLVIVDAASAVRSGRAWMVKRLDVSQEFVAAVLDRCLGGRGGFVSAAGSADDSKSYFSKPIRFLVRHRVVGLHSRPALPHGSGADPLRQVLPSAMRAQDLDLLASFLQHVLDLSAVDLARLISFFLSQAPSPGSDDSKLAATPDALRAFARARLNESLDGTAGRASDGVALNTTDGSPEDRAVEYFLDCIVVLPLNDIAAQHVLKYLTLDVVLRLLHYLLGWFKMHALYSGKFLQQKRRAAAREQRDGKLVFVAPTPELGDIVTWLSLVLDAHFAELVLVKDCHQILRDTQACLRDHVALCERVEGLAGLLEVFLHHKPIPQNKRKDYVIEALQL